MAAVRTFLQKPTFFHRFSNRSAKMTRRMSLIVAMDEDGGIGKGGRLPWKLSKDMKYFANITQKVNDPAKRNAVIMGRKCWESIPAKFRPLPGRLNVVLSRSLPQRQDSDVIICSDFDKAVEVLSSPPFLEEIETVWNIGGRDIYEAALVNDLVDKLVVTNINARFDTDVQLKGIVFEKFEEVRDHPDFGIIHEEAGIPFVFKHFHRIVS